MQYFGGKARIAKVLVPELQKHLKSGQTFVDAFCGSCNILSAIKAKSRIGNDLHKELISLHKAIQDGWIPPDSISQEDYVKAKSGECEVYLKAFIGFGCSFSGKYFGGYARAGERNYALNAKNSLLRKHKTMGDVQFICGEYVDIFLPENSLIYCDIPYRGTTSYSTGHFDHKRFYACAKEWKDRGHTVLVSEYAGNVPDGWDVVWQHNSRKDIRNRNGEQERTVEVLMRP